jgi:hypothetical protein
MDEGVLMRKYACLASAAILAACGPTNARNADSASQRAASRDTAPPDATPPTESIASRPRASAVNPSTAAKTSGSRPQTVSRHDTKSAAAPLSGTDTIRGIVSVVGTSRDQRVMIAPTTGGRHMQITGSSAALIGHLAGADVMVTGERSGTIIDVSDFVVKTVDGAPAIDGTLKTEGSALFIVTRDGSRTRIVVPPPPLVGHDGARVWITGDPAKAVSSFGFIDPPR